jgi:hypothetical protein
MSDPVEFCGEIKWETDAAYKVYDGTNEVWIPKSKVISKRRVSSSVVADFIFEIPEWLAVEKMII